MAHWIERNWPYVIVVWVLLNAATSLLSISIYGNTKIKNQVNEKGEEVYSRSIQYVDSVYAEPLKSINGKLDTIINGRN